jgi:elongation factor P
MAVETQDFNRNLKIEIDGEPYVVVDCQHVKPGKGVGYVKTKIKNLKTGKQYNETFRSGETYDEPRLESRDMEYLYKDDQHYVFMDQENYEQVRLNESAVEEVLPFLKDNQVVKVMFHEGTPIQVELPTFVELEVTQAPPGVKGNTAQGGTKKATLETGADIDVPLYLEQGETVKVDTRNGEFVERVND